MKRVVKPETDLEWELLANLMESETGRAFFARALRNARVGLTAAEGDEILRFQGAARLLEGLCETMSSAQRMREDRRRDNA